jgi:hypothetical protein
LCERIQIISIISHHLRLSRSVALSLARARAVPPVLPGLSSAPPGRGRRQHTPMQAYLRQR